MPNGFHNDPSLDLIIHRHTEHGHFRFHTYRGTYGFASVHVEHHGGYAYEPRWETLDLAPFVRTRRTRPTRAEMEALTADLVAQLMAVQSSNPSSRVNADRAAAFLLLEGWCVLLGRYHTYTRTDGGLFEQVVPTVGSRCDEETRKHFAVHPGLEYAFRDTSVLPQTGLICHTPSECVYDFSAVDELLASTAPLHEHREWSEIARLPIDSIESTGRVVVALRDDGVEHGHDHLLIRWRNKARAKKQPSA